MVSPRLHRVDLTSPGIVEELARILRSHLPYSLTILGSLFSTSDNLTSVGSESPSVIVWTSFQDFTSPPAVYSVIALSPSNDNQFRLFCSAESNPGSPTQEDQNHVVDVVRSFARTITTVPTRGVDAKDVLKKHKHDPRPVIHFGCVHDKWLECLKPQCIETIGCLTALRVSRSVVLPQPPGQWELSRIKEEDIDFIRSRTVFPRSHEFLVSRLRWTVCIRSKGGSGPPIAWQFVLPDGSLGMLHVEPEYRRLHLARIITAASCMGMEQMFYTEDKKKRDLYPWLRWEYAHILLGNEASLRMTEKLEDWELDKNWVCHWMYIVAANEPAGSLARAIKSHPKL